MEEFSSIHSQITSALVSTTRSASTLVSDDVSFHRSLDASLGPALDRQNARLLALADRLLGAATADTEIVRPPRLKDLESVDANWSAVVDVLDSLLERADTALDEFTGAVKRLTPRPDQAVTSKPLKLSKIARALQSQDLEKPQLSFAHVPTNNEAEPFKPLVQSKPHAVMPLGTEPITDDTTGLSSYPHPYQHEIEQYRYPPSIYSHSEPIPPKPFDSTTATFVDTEEAVEEMLAELKQAKEIAVDLEHHDSRSFIGIVSLMQISTRNRDWIVDTLKPWRRKLVCLNEVFADPTIVKVLHGAFMDIVWLQRDLGLYVVGLFDTHYAARELGYTGGSLAFLLKKFVDVDAQKQYQTADWRIRPLPQELVDYARSDTHYLLYIFDCMRNELVERSNFGLANHEGDKLWGVQENSKETALQRYEHPTYDTKLGQGPMGWYRLLTKTTVLFNKEQFSVFRAVHMWRDNVAREQDDSLHYVMPNHQIFTIAKEMPASRPELLGIVQPLTQTVRLRADELVGVIKRARDDGQDGPDMMDLITQIDKKFPRYSHRNMVLQATKIEQSSMPSAVSHPPPPQATALNSVRPLRSSTSTFWGPAFESSAWSLQKRELSTTHDLSLTVPLPPLTAEVFTDIPSPLPAREQAQASPEIDPTSLQGEGEDDIFVLKDMLSKKRRRHTLEPSAAGDAMAAQSDLVGIADDNDDSERDQRAREKAERKRAKKAAKRAAKQTDGSASSDAPPPPPPLPFDYASAPSVLSPPRDIALHRAGKAKGKPGPANPYVKALDAPRGLPRAQKERAGRSMTYQS